MYNLAELCGKAKALGYFGSYTREEDYVDELSDINVFAISSDRSLVLELGSYGFSPLVISEDYFKDLCDKGDPICYYLLYDSKIICGELPRTTFKLSDYTCERLKKETISFLKISYEAYIRQDEKSALLNAARALRSLVQFKSCQHKVKIPISNKELKESCKKLGLNFCDALEQILEMKKLKIPISLGSISKIRDIISSNLDIDSSSLKLGE